MTSEFWLWVTQPLFYTYYNGWKSQFTSTFSWVSLNFGVKNQTEERFSRDIQILNETFLAKYCVMRYFLLSLELNDDCDVDPSLRLLYPWPVAKMSAQVTCNVQPQILGWCMVFAGPLAPYKCTVFKNHPSKSHLNFKFAHNYLCFSTTRQIFETFFFNFQTLCSIL